MCLMTALVHVTHTIHTCFHKHHSVCHVRLERYSLHHRKDYMPCTLHFAGWIITDTANIFITQVFESFKSAWLESAQCRRVHIDSIVGKHSTWKPWRGKHLPQVIFKWLTFDHKLSQRSAIEEKLAIAVYQVYESFLSTFVNKQHQVSSPKHAHSPAQDGNALQIWSLAGVHEQIMKFIMHTVPYMLTEDEDEVGCKWALFHAHD